MSVEEKSGEKKSESDIKLDEESGHKSEIDEPEVVEAACSPKTPPAQSDVEDVVMEP
jgi:hypothetical protein